MGVLSCKMKNSKIVLLVIVVLIAIGGYVIFSPDEMESTEEKIHVTVYKSPNCGCCNNYIGYLKRKGFEVEKINTDDMETVRESNGIPYNLESCHTTIIGDYVVEGHIPIEAINSLLEDKPAIKGIAMPGMPSGSPGMPGAKLANFTIYSLNEDGGSSVYLEL